MTTIRKMTVATVIVLGLALLTAGSAAAYSKHSSGRPGTATVPLTIGAAETAALQAQVYFPVRTVYRSPATSSAQYVTVRYRVYKDASTTYPSGAQQWYFYNEFVSKGWINRGQSSRTFSAWSDAGSGDHPYSVDVTIWWQASNGTVLGSNLYDYNATGDYLCNYRVPQGNAPYCVVAYGFGSAFMYLGQLY